MNYYNDDTILFLDGEWLKAKDARMDLYGQSLHYGYAVFEGIRSYQTGNGPRVFKSRQHYERLIFSAGAVGIPFSYTPEELDQITYELLEKNGFADAYIRPLVFCPPGMTLMKAASSHLMICAWQWPAYLGDKMLRIMTSSIRRPNPGAFRMEAKVSGHYVNSIMASQEARDRGYDEALLLNDKGFIAEGPGANFFVEKNGVLYTPAKGHILPGITRATVLELCRELNIQVQETELRIEQVKGADAAFYCGTAAEVIGIESLDDVSFRKPWHETISALIQKAYKRRVLEQDLPARSSMQTT